MRVFILAFLLAASLATASSTGRTVEKSWERACHWTELVTSVSCEGMDAPKVFYMPDRLMDAFLGKGVRGFFFPSEGVVYVRMGMAPFQRYLTQTHEMVHYILDQKYGRSVPRCASEEAARMVTDLEAGRPYTSDWKRWYNCDPTISPFGRR